MEVLPALPRDHLLTYLPLSDILSCSSVSIGWRDVVNSDYIWKKMCYRQSNESTIAHIRFMPPSVCTKNIVMITEDNRLKPLCYWRSTYIKLQRVKKNWRRGKHETYSVIDLAYDHYDLKIDNDLLVANVNDNQCELWDIREDPKIYQTITCALKNTRCKCMIHLNGDRLVIVQDTLLQVYCREGKIFILHYRRVFDQSEAISESIPGSINVDEWYNSLVKRRPSSLQSVHVGKYFIGTAQNKDKNVLFHIWNAATGEKLREEYVDKMSPDIKDPVKNIKFCTSKSDLGKVLVCVEHVKVRDMESRSYYTVLYVYDLKTLSFKRLMNLKPHVPWVFYEDRFFMTLTYTQVKLSVFDSSSGLQLMAKQYEETINPDSVQVHGSYLGFTTGGDIVILNTEDFDLVFTTAIHKFSSNLFGFDFTFLDWNLILIAHYDKKNKLEVWSIDEKRQLSTLKVGGLIFPCDNFAKFFVWNEMVTTIYMLEFW